MVSVRIARLFSNIAIFTAIVFLGAVIIYWGWFFFAPKSFYVAPAAPSDPVMVLRATSLFGAGAATNTEVTALPATISGNVRLLGLIAQNDGDGYAVFRAGGNVFIARAGDDVGGENTLLSVEPSAMVLREKNGNERRIVLREDASGKDAAAVSPQFARNPPDSSNSCVPADFQGIVIRLNTELLQGVLIKPETFYALLSAQGEGLVVQADSGHAAMLGLRRGDQLHTANGIRLRRPEDITQAILKPLVGGQTVRLAGRRGGQDTELLLVNVSACGS